MSLSKCVICVIVKNQRVLTENLNDVEGFEHLFFIAGRAGKVDDYIEKRSSFHQINIQEGNAYEGEHLSVTDLVIRSFHCFFCNKSISKFFSGKI